MSGYYQAIGRNLNANLLSISRGFIFQFVLTITLPPIIGVAGVFLSLPLAELLTIMILVVILLVEQFQFKKVEKLSLD